MRSGGGKAKGSEFERRVSKQLSLWLSKGERDDLLWRSAMSGGRATLQLRKDIINQTQSGDLTAIAPLAYVLCQSCLFECKSYRDLQLMQGVFKDTGKFKKFWIDTVEAARRYDKIPVLICKQNQFPVLLVCPDSCQVFDGNPLVELKHWGAVIYRFDEATSMPETRQAQRARPAVVREPKQLSRTQHSESEYIAPPTPQGRPRRSLI